MSIWSNLFKRVYFQPDLQKLSRENTDKVYFQYKPVELSRTLPVISEGERKEVSGVTKVCVSGGLDPSHMTVEQLLDILVIGECYFRGIPFKRTYDKTFNVSTNEGIKWDKVVYKNKLKRVLTQAQWVEEPVYSFVQIFLENPRRFKTTTEGKNQCITDKMTGETFNAEVEWHKPSHAYDTGCWWASYPNINFVGFRSLDWAREKISTYYSHRRCELNRINNIRKRRRLMNIYVKKEKSNG